MTGKQIASPQGVLVGNTQVQLPIDADLQTFGQRRFAKHSRTVDEEHSPRSLPFECLRGTEAGRHLASSSGMLPSPVGLRQAKEDPEDRPAFGEADMLRRGQEFLVARVELLTATQTHPYPASPSARKHGSGLSGRKSWGLACLHGLGQIVWQCIDLSGREGDPAHDLHQSFLQLAPPGRCSWARSPSPGSSNRSDDVI